MHPHSVRFSSVPDIYIWEGLPNFNPNSSCILWTRQIQLWCPLQRGLPKGIFRGEERYGARVDMCHFGLVGSGNPNPSNFRATHMAAATLRPALTPLVADLNGYCTSNAPPWFTWCSI